MSQINVDNIKSRTVVAGRAVSATKLLISFA